MAVIILGLGLVMVATMFPVAWDRARTLAEFTTEQSVWPMADQTVRSLVPCATTDFNTEVPPALPVGFTAMGFAGDLLIDGAFDLDPMDPPPTYEPIDVYEEIDQFYDDRVHALNLQNIRVQDRDFVPEDPWEIELTRLAVPMGAQADLNFDANNYTTPRVLFHQRVYPPMERVPNNFYDDPDLTPMQVERWEAELDTKRFAWGVLHRLRTDFSNITTGTPTQEAVRRAATSTRVFDMYYVTLRRSNPTNRYARQDAATVPDPDEPDWTDPTVAEPRALPPMADVMFPTPWRVQIKFPSIDDLADRVDMTDPLFPATNIPTEVAVPPDEFTGSDEAAQMLVNMFPSGTTFVDERSGQIYQVTRQRLADNAGTSAVLTLDREVFDQDLNDAEERIRTVWVYPPPAPNREAGDRFPAFEGNSPVVDIQLRTVPISPRRN